MDSKNCLLHSFNDAKEIKKLQENILEWYAREHRNLPWRIIARDEKNINRKTYAVWVSEIMCQQTQVATVVKYFNKWIEKWPSVVELSKASLEEVNQVWAGLGYYSRARRLHEGAIKVVDVLQGVFPQNRSELEKQLPGVGKYTSSAIASIVFREPVGVVDGNVMRVLSRLRVVGGDISTQSVIDHFWKLADFVVPVDEPGDFNQAMMELGALVCTPKNPSCKVCPVKDICHAYQRTSSSNGYFKGNVIHDIECDLDCQMCLKNHDYDISLGVQNYPRKYKKTKVTSKTNTVFVFRVEVHPKNSVYLLVQRPKKGLLANLWEFYNVLQENKTDKETSDIDFEMSSLSFDVHPSNVVSKRFVGDVTHIFSHILQTYRVYEVVLKKEMKLPLQAQYQATKWMTEIEYLSSATSTAMKKVFKSLKLDQTSDDLENLKRKQKTATKDDGKKQKKMTDFFGSS